MCVLQGFYMYIETSRPRKEGDQARLVSPFFNVAPKNPYGITNPPAYCLGFFYHMYGKHIGKILIVSLSFYRNLCMEESDAVLYFRSLIKFTLAK